MRTIQRFPFFQTALMVTIGYLLSDNAGAQPAPANVTTTPLVQEIPTIEVFGRPNSEPKAAEKTPIQKLRAKLDAVPPTTNFSVRDYIGNDGIRKAEITTMRGKFCLQERRGQIDFSGLNKDMLGRPMKPIVNDCR